MKFENKIRFSPDNQQKIRESMAKLRQNFQEVAKGIYPEASGLASGEANQEGSQKSLSEQNKTNATNPGAND
jgi:hypothetical protein